MAKKRLIIEVDEAVHSRLKAEAASKGAHLGPHCASILEESFNRPSDSIEFDVGVIKSLPLDRLRELSVSLRQEKSKNYKKEISLIESEILRRYRT